MTHGMKLAVFAVAVVVPVAQGQYTGVSRPEQIPAQTPTTASVDGISQPAAYEPTPPGIAAQVKLKTRPADGMVVTTTVAPAYGAPADGTVARVESREYVAETARPDVRPADMDGQIVMEFEGPANVLPEGTLIKARIKEWLSTVGTPTAREFHAELTEAVERNGRVLIPAGSTVAGRVSDVHGGKRISGPASIHLQPMEVTMPDGVKYRIGAQVVDTDLYNQMRVDQEGTLLRRDHAGKTLAVMGLATGSGVAAGGLIAGVPGAVVGGLVGAGVGTTVWLKQDRQMEIPAGTRITFALNQALVVGVE